MKFSCIRKIDYDVDCRTNFCPSLDPLSMSGFLSKRSKNSCAAETDAAIRSDLEWMPIDEINGNLKTQ